MSVRLFDRRFSASLIAILFFVIMPLLSYCGYLCYSAVNRPMFTSWETEELRGTLLPYWHRSFGFLDNYRRMYYVDQHLNVIVLILLEKRVPSEASFISSTRTTATFLAGTTSEFTIPHCRNKLLVFRDGAMIKEMEIISSGVDLFLQNARNAEGKFDARAGVEALGIEWSFELDK